jgi:hypothetical protein
MIHYWKTILTHILFALLVTLSFFTQAQNGSTPAAPSDLTEEYVLAKCNQIAESKTTEQFDAASMADLPIAIINNPAVIIAVDSAYSNERGWFFSAYASVMLPGTSKPLAFAARNIAFNGKGLAASSLMKLILVTTKPINLGDQVKLELTGDGRNYIEFNCDGFRSINLKGNFLFNESLLQADQELSKGQTTVRASFEVNTPNLNNLMMAVNITPFKVKGLDDLSFEVKNAVADYSDIVNPPGLSLPKEYQQTLGSDILLWRGFYLQEVNIRVKNMADDPAKAPTISARNLLIDDLGVTGTFAATNLLSLQDGSADGWPLSIDQLSLKLMFNKVAGGSLSGLLNIPFLGEEPIPYTALIEQIDNQVNYRFAVSTNATKEYETPFSAKIQIDKGSVIALEKRNGKVFGSAKLQGMLVVDHSIAKFSGIRFQDLQLVTQKPYLVGGIFSTVSSGEKKSEGLGFPLSIDSVSLKVFQGEAAIQVGVSLNLMEGKGFSASTTIQMVAKVKETILPTNPSSDVPATPAKRHEWKFDRVKINTISIASASNAIYLKGQLNVYEKDPVYGTGFGGKLDFKINSLMNDAAKVTAFFGSMPTYRYWHLDAYVPTTIPLGPVVTLKGLQGGASYHMSRKQPFQPDFKKITPEAMLNQGPTGQSTFVPDEATGMAFMAGTTLVIKNESIVNADALLEVAFNANGGLRYVQFTGSAFFFTPIEKRGRVEGNQVPAAPVYANLNMLYDNNNKVFHANLKTYLNVEGQLKGTGPNHLVGEAVVHTDPGDWYIYIGRPTQRFSVSLGGLATAQTYFMTGTKMESLPPPPAEVQQVFGKIESSLMRDAGTASMGRSFASGVYFSTGVNKRITPFYVVLMVAAGADVMLRDYGDANCEGRSGKIGINGWYASGQAYAFLKGKVGIQVKGSDFDIVSVGAAALLQAKLPNPTWLKGELAGNYKVLGGLVKGSFKLKLIVGDECEIQKTGSELDNIKVIADVKPDDSGQEVNVFSAPQVSFNTSVETEFSMPDGNDTMNNYRIRLSEFSVSKAGTSLAGRLEWNSTKDVVVLRTAEILPPQTKLKATVKLYWEKKTGNGNWEAVKQNGQVAYETRENNFTTGTAPSFIPDENVAYSYPMKNQYNFYTNESGNGYVKLRMGQDYLFGSDKDGKTYQFIARFQPLQGQAIEVPLTYQTAQTTVSYEIPSALSRQAIYKLTFVKRPLTGGAVDQNLTRSEVKGNAGGDNEMTLASNNLQGVVANNVDKDIYTSAFRTSQFGKFEEKMNSMNNLRDVFDVAVGNIAVIGKRGELTETFDEVELKGKEGQTDPLVQVIASPENTWMRQYISPLLYDQYPMDNEIKINWRTPEVLGVKPLKGVTLVNDQGGYSLTDAQITTGSASSKGGSVVLGYYLSYYTFRDYYDLRNQAGAKYMSNWNSAPPAARRLLTAPSFTGLIEGDYPVTITYMLPGTHQVTYNREIRITY